MSASTHFYRSFKDVESDGDCHFSFANDEANVKSKSAQICQIIKLSIFHQNYVYVRFYVRVPKNVT